jgi:hypothetical protein
LLRHSFPSTAIKTLVNVFKKGKKRKGGGEADILPLSWQISAFTG